MFTYSGIYFSIDVCVCDCLCVFLTLLFALQGDEAENNPGFNGLMKHHKEENTEMHK